MRMPFANLDAAAGKFGAATEKAGEVVRDSLGLVVGVAVLGVAALVLSIIAILIAKAGPR